MKKEVIKLIIAGIFIITIIIVLYIAVNTGEPAIFSEPLTLQGSLTGNGGQIPSGDDYVAIATGPLHQLALHANGSVNCWGDNRDGQCDVPHEDDFVAISAGYEHSLGLRSDGTIACWGQQLFCKIPIENDFISISAGSQNSLALRLNGTIVCWGRNASNECNIPREDDFVAISAGNNHGLALRSNGTIACWYAKEYCNVPPGNDYVAISASSHSSLALKSNGEIVSWGITDFRDGWNYVPPVNDAVAISDGHTKHLAIRSDGSVVCWGEEFANSCDIIPESDIIAISGTHAESLGITNPQAKEILAGEWQKTKVRITSQTGRSSEKQQPTRPPVYPGEYVINTSLPTVSDTIIAYSIINPENITQWGAAPIGIYKVTSVNFLLFPDYINKDPYHFIPYREFAIKSPSVAIEEFKTHRLSVDYSYMNLHGPVDDADKIVLTNISLGYLVRPTVAGAYILQPAYRFEGYVEKQSARSSFNWDYVPATESLVEFDFLQNRSKYDGSDIEK